MKLYITAKTNAKTSRLEQVDNSHFNVWVSAPPIENKANEQIIDLLSRHLSIPKSQILLRSGAKSKQKAFEII